MKDEQSFGSRQLSTVVSQTQKPLSRCHLSQLVTSSKALISLSHVGIYERFQLELGEGIHLLALVPLGDIRLDLVGLLQPVCI
jgi:hypothetical protein